MRPLLMPCGNRRSDKGLGQKATPTVPSAGVQTPQLESKVRSQKVRVLSSVASSLEPHWGLLLLRFSSGSCYGDGFSGDTV